MEVSEDRELKRITGEFAKGIELFKQHRYQDAAAIFNAIIAGFKDSPFYSVVEVETRSKVYKNICEAQLNPVKIELHSDEDYLKDGIFNLNAGNPDIAFERLNYLKEKKYTDPYLNYLLSLVYLKKGDKENCISHLKKAIGQDEAYRIIAHNEPDFDSIFDDPSFSQSIEMKNEY